MVCCKLKLMQWLLKDLNGQIACFDNIKQYIISGCHALNRKRREEKRNEVVTRNLSCLIIDKDPLNLNRLCYREAAALCLPPAAAIVHFSSLNVDHNNKEYTASNGIWYVHLFYEIDQESSSDHCRCLQVATPRSSLEVLWWKVSVSDRDR